MAYPDMHAHLKTLEANGYLRRIQRTINKDTELHPLVRWQYRGLPEEERKAWLFENVTDSKGHEKQPDFNMLFSSFVLFVSFVVVYFG